MDLLFATWTLRFAVLAAVAVAAVSLQAGCTLLDAVDRGLAAAAGFTVAGRLLVGYFESPDRRMIRMRRKREELRARRARAAAGAAGRRSTVSKTA